MSVVLITGASSGIGLACACHLAERGYRVYGASRHPEAVSSHSLEMLYMDVTSDESVACGVRAIVEKEGRLDVIVNNAGISLVGPIEDVTIAEAQALFETNLWGVLRVCQAALPVMREQHSGRIINISSIAGRASAAYQGLYSASKFAVEGLSEALRTEVRHCGIKVSLVEPGDAPTGHTYNRTRILRTPAYAPYYYNAMQVYEHDEKNGYPPAKIARLVERIIQAPNPRMRYVCGLPLQTIGATLKPFIPYSLFERALALVYKF